MSAYTLYDYWIILYQRRKTVLLIVSFSVMFALGLSYVLPEVYEAKSVFYVPSKGDSLTFFSDADRRQITRSLLVPEPKGEQQKVYIGMLESDALRRKVLERFPQKTLRDLKKDVDFNSGTDFLLELYVRDRDPGRAAQIANTYVKLFDQTLGNYSLNTTVEQRASMARELEETQQRLVEAQRLLEGFQRTHKMPLVDEESQHLTSYKTDLEKSLGEAEVQLAEVKRKTESLRKELTKESSSYTESSTALSSPLVELLQKQLSDLEGQIAAARASYTDSHPTVVSLRAQYEQKARDLSNEIKRIMGSESKAPNSFVESLRQDLIRLVIERDTLEARVDGIRRSLGDLAQQMVELPGVRTDYQRLKRDVDQYQGLVENLKGALAEAAAQAQRELKSVVVVDEATAPERPVFPDPFINTLVALGLGLVGGVFYAYFIDYLDRFKLNLAADIKELEREYV